MDYPDSTLRYEVSTAGVIRWYHDDMLHRDEGPAVIYPNGGEQWYQYDYLHRDDGPAAIHPNGLEFWYIYGGLHRTDGPAVIDPVRNSVEWWFDNIEYKSFEEWAAAAKIKDTEVYVLLRMEYG